MLKKIFLTALFCFGVGVGNAFATGDQLPYVPIKKLTELAETPASGNDFLGVYDASADSTKKIDVNRLSWTGAVNGEFRIGTDTYVMSAFNPGSGTLGLDKFTTYVFTDNTGALPDRAHIPDGTTVGQQKRIVLAEDIETSGLEVAPISSTMGPRGTQTSILLEEPGESITFEWSGAALGWVIVADPSGGTFEPDTT